MEEVKKVLLDPTAQSKLEDSFKEVPGTEGTFECSECKGAVPDSAKMCPSCGAEFEVDPQEEGGEVAKGSLTPAKANGTEAEPPPPPPAPPTSAPHHPVQGPTMEGVSKEEHAARHSLPPTTSVRLLSPIAPRA